MAFSGGSVRDSVYDLIGAYISSFFPNTKEGVNPFKSSIDLWRMGYVPSFDGKVWRLHTVNGVVYEYKSK